MLFTHLPILIDACQAMFVEMCDPRPTKNSLIFSQVTGLHQRWSLYSSGRLGRVVNVEDRPPQELFKSSCLALQKQAYVALLPGANKQHQEMADTHDSFVDCYSD